MSRFRAIGHAVLLLAATVLSLTSTFSEGSSLLGPFGLSENHPFATPIVAVGSRAEPASTVNVANLTSTASFQGIDDANGCNWTSQTAVFSGSASGGYPPYNFTWEFGDGSARGYGPNPEHRYLYQGNLRVTFNVTLTVTDNRGDSNQSHTQATIIFFCDGGPAMPSNPIPLLVTLVVIGGGAVAAVGLSAVLAKRRAR